MFCDKIHLTKYMHSIMSRLSGLTRFIIQCTLNSDVCITSALNRTWIGILSNIM